MIQQAAHLPETVTVEVFSPREVDPKTFTFPTKDHIEKAAREAATAFGYAGGNPTFSKNKVVLDRKLTLAQAGVHDGDVLELVDVGGGV